MSPDPSTLKTSICKTNEKAGSESKIVCSDVQIRTATTTCQPSDNGAAQNMEASNTPALAIGEFQTNIDAPTKAPSLSLCREKRNVSPSSVNLHEAFVDPQSPSSSSSTSQTTSANDATFEPTIEMMVNDFDDEQTLNEEEALASLESQDPDEEINTLKEESEMPLEELLAKYRALPPQPPSTELSRKKSKKSSSHKKKHKSKQKRDARATQTLHESIEESPTSVDVAEASKHGKTNTEMIIPESGDEKDLADDKRLEDYDEECASSTLSPRKPPTPSIDEERKEDDGIISDNGITHGEILKVRRSHLLDLYPEGTFDNVVVVNDDMAGDSKDIPLESLYGVEDDDEEIEEEEDEDYKKKVMIGTLYQATIPVGLSQYGDILPYENEDKLIWEPSQVSEREVEEYLIKIRDIKSNQQGEEEVSAIETNLENHSKENGRAVSNKDNLENNSLLANGDKLHVEASATTIDMDSQAVIKDNEQALHLLVQCGYDFKEALRRKRLNALPLNDCMSLWSEEECHKFEEGIQKYGKDFLKIRQNQVRTRTMRELVQFYYLWKKSERRDHNFANADTVDHMDIYLNEDNEYGSNPASVITPVGSPVGNNSNCPGTRRNSNASQKNISIMTTTSTNNSTPAATNSTSPSTSLQQQHQQHHKRRTHTSNATTSDFNDENSSTLQTNSTK
ncbi:mesoderm induction early response protein 1 isoform X2 [Calliphora vicina]|uniref:mesoderm induction early response protein 1 isoform X2 n=1 Tax=Calliphora vicina TaxID=7373 RepID=UPI00325B4193